MTDARDIRVTWVDPVLPALLDWADVDPTTRWGTDARAAFVAGWHSRDPEVAALRAEIARLKDEQR